MAHHTPFVNHEILEAKPREKDFTLHGGDGLFLLVKASVKNFGASATSALTAIRPQELRHVWQGITDNAQRVWPDYNRCRTNQGMQTNPTLKADSNNDWLPK